MVAGAGFADVFFDLLDAAQFDLRAAAGFVGSCALAAIFVGEEVGVRAEFGVEVRVGAGIWVTAASGREPGPMFVPTAGPGRRRPDGTREMGGPRRCAASLYCVPKRPGTGPIASVCASEDMRAPRTARRGALTLILSRICGTG